MAVVGNIVKGIINIDHKVIIEALIEVYFEVIAKRNTMSVRSQIAKGHLSGESRADSSWGKG